MANHKYLDFNQITKIKQNNPKATKYPTTKDHLKILDASALQPTALTLLPPIPTLPLFQRIG